MRQFISTLAILITIITCSTLISATFYSDYDNEGESIFKADDIGCPVFPTYNKLNWRKMLGHWHLPYASENWMAYKPKDIHGRKPVKKSSYTHTCIKATVSVMPDNSKESNGTGTGNFGLNIKCPRTSVAFSLNCSSNAKYGGDSALICTDMDQPFNNEPKSEISVVDTDYVTYALVIRCIPSRGSYYNYDSNWAIFSRVKSLDQKLVKDLLNLISDVGLELYHVIEIPYAKCR